MVQIIQAHQPRQNHAKLIGDQLAEGMRNYFEKQAAAEALKGENEALESQGVHVTGIQNPKIRELMSASALKGEKVDTKSMQKGKELEGALETIQRMRDLRKQDNLGWGSQITRLFSPKARKDAGEYEQLGKSLISLASNIPIRNKQEFETLAERLYDPAISDDEAEGILSAMERIIQNSQNVVSDQPKGSKSSKNERPSLTTFMR
jgi:hypothetical protein